MNSYAQWLKVESKVLQPRHRQRATVLAETGSMMSPVVLTSYPHWLPFDKNHMSPTLFFLFQRHGLLALFCSINPDHQFPRALSLMSEHVQCRSDKDVGRGKVRWKENREKTGELTVPLNSPRWLFCWALLLCRGTVQCPQGCSGEDHSPKETGFPVFKERASAV